MNYYLKKRPEYRGFPLLVFSNPQGLGSDKLHKHDFIELALVRSGWASHCICDDVRKCMHTRDLIRRDFYIIPPGIRHKFEDKHNILLYTMAFLPELLTKEELGILSVLPALQCVFGTKKFQPSRLHLLPLEFTYVEGLLRKIMFELQLARGRNVHWLMARTLAVEYLITIGKHKLEEWTHSPQRADTNILQALEDMEQNPQKHWNLPEMSKKYGMCVSGFGRKFRELAGLPPMKYCRFLRLEQVRHALISSDEPIGDIAIRFGFVDSNHLVKMFRQNYRITPLVFRRRAREISSESV